MEKRYELAQRQSTVLSISSADAVSHEFTPLGQQCFPTLCCSTARSKDKCGQGWGWTGLVPPASHSHHDIITPPVVTAGCPHGFLLAAQRENTHHTRRNDFILLHTISLMIWVVMKSSTGEVTTTEPSLQSRCKAHKFPCYLLPS